MASSANLRPFYSYVNRHTKSRTTIGPLKSNDELVTDDTGMTNILNTFFSSVFTREDLSNIPSPTNKPCTDPILELSCTKENVMEVLTKLKPFSAHGPYGIPTKLLLDYAVYLADPLTTIFNMSLASGNIPIDWCLANITPIFK